MTLTTSQTDCMASTLTMPTFPHKLRFSEKFRISLRKRWFGPMRSPGARRVVRCRYFGAEFVVNLEDVIGHEIAINRFEWRELKIMLDACQRLKPEIFFDVGANLGLYSCVLAKNNAVPRIVAFEPDRANHQRMMLNLQINGLRERVELHEQAVGAAAGRASLVPSGASNRGMSHLVTGEESDGFAVEGGYSVEVVKLDDMFRLNDTTIAGKIDVEGFELEVLMGAAQLLTRNKGFIQIEGRFDRVAGVITELMATFGWRFVERYGIDLRFEKS
jgi:FkbM family methyltransferase